MLRKLCLQLTASLRNVALLLQIAESHVSGKHSEAAMKATSEARDKAGRTSTVGPPRFCSPVQLSLGFLMGSPAWSALFTEASTFSKWEASSSGRTVSSFHGLEFGVRLLPAALHEQPDNREFFTHERYVCLLTFV